MKLLDLSLPTPAANLACDEALLDACESGAGEDTLRFWESGEYFVVVGYSNKIHTEVNVAECERRGIPVLRRCSGGGTVVQGPGCLNYALILENTFDSITETNRYIMDRHCAALQALWERASAREPAGDRARKGAPTISVQGHTDLVLGDRKISGNSQRRRKHYLLFHGAILLNFDPQIIESLLPVPSRKPAYRGQRSHTEFLTNLRVSSDAIKEALIKIWNATETAGAAPSAEIRHLVETKYSTKAWNYRC